MQRRRGRPLTPLDPAASCGARLGAELREQRLARGLTLQALADLTGYAPQHVSEVERAKTTPTQRFIAACEVALRADGRLLPLLPGAIDERMAQREERTAARRAARRAEGDPALRCAASHSEAGGDDVKPTNRRGLIGAGTAAALGGVGMAAAPAQARRIDPELPAHWTNLLRLLGRHDEIFGPREVLASVKREIKVIAEHRQAARGELRTALVRVEARWAELAAWLSEDTGQPRARDAWIDRALRLAIEADYADMLAFARARQSEWAGTTRRMIALAEDGLSLSNVSPQTRAWCSRQFAISHAMAGDAASCERYLAVAYDLLDDDDSPAPPWAGEYRVSRTGTRAAEARCWLAMAPAKAIVLYDEALRGWPHSEARDGGIHQARLALACAMAGEPDRAKAEGAKALAVAKQTRSTTAARELHRLRQTLAA